MTIEKFLFQYHQAKLESYSSKDIGGDAASAAQFALMDMVATVKRQKEIYSDAQICEMLTMEIEDVYTAIAARKAA